MAAPYPGSRKKPTAPRTLAAKFLMLLLEKALQNGGFVREVRITHLDYDFGHFSGEDLVKHLVWKAGHMVFGTSMADRGIVSSTSPMRRWVENFLEAHRVELAEIELTRQPREASL